MFPSSGGTNIDDVGQLLSSLDTDIDFGCFYDYTLLSEDCTKSIDGDLQFPLTCEFVEPEMVDPSVPAVSDSTQIASEAPQSVEEQSPVIPTSVEQLEVDDTETPRSDRKTQSTTSGRGRGTRTGKRTIHPNQSETPNMDKTFILLHDEKLTQEEMHENNPTRLSRPVVIAKSDQVSSSGTASGRKRRRSNSANGKHSQHGDNSLNEPAETSTEILDPKREKRKEQNRRAATKCRNKRKVAEDQLKKDFEEVQRESQRRKQEVKFLCSELARYGQVLRLHMASGTCRHPGPGATQLLPGLAAS